MGFELEHILYRTEDFLRRNIRSKSAREAQKRRAQRKLGEVLRRLRRAAFLFAGMLVALVGASIITDVGLLTWIIAIPTTLLIAFLSLFWGGGKPVEAAEAPPAAPLDELAARAEDALIERCSELPGRALPAADAIIARLHEIQPHLAGVERNPMLAGDARRLICQHLPKLVDTYLDLPPSARAPGSEASTRLTESLGIVAQELDHLLDQCCRDRHLSFETQSRFIESRYKDDEALKRE